MTSAERRCATPRFPWGGLASAPLDGLLAVVPAVVLVGLPLYLILAVAHVDDPGSWVSLVGIGTFAYAVVRTGYPALSGFLRARARVDDDLIYDEVDDRIVEVTDCIEVAGDVPSYYLRCIDGQVIVLAGDYVVRLRRAGCFPSTALRLIQLPRSQAVVGLLPLGEVLTPSVVSAKDHHRVELDGQPSQVDFAQLLMRADRRVIE